MSAAIAKREPTEVIEQVIAKGDLKELTPAQRTEYFHAVCQSVGLNPLTRPFEYITLNGKLTLYARKDATDQLRKLHGVSVQIVSRERIDDAYAVTAKATDAKGRTDESIGAVAIGSLKGDALCNAIMKAETKAKRRVTLSICGLGMLDEAELETIPTARMPEPERPSPVPPGVSFVEDEVMEAEPEPVKQVKLEGAQPTGEHADELPTNLKGQAGQIMALARALKFAEPELASLIQNTFGTIVMPGKLAAAVEFMTGEEHRELIRELKQRLGGR